MYDCNVYCSGEWIKWYGEHAENIAYRLVEGAVASLPPNARGKYLIRARNPQCDAMDYAVQVDLTNSAIGVCWWDEIPAHQQQNYIPMEVGVARADA